MTVTIEIDTENAAFDNRDAEVARILTDIADQIDDGRIDTMVEDIKTIRDVNGNTTGSITIF